MSTGYERCADFCVKFGTQLPIHRPGRSLLSVGRWGRSCGRPCCRLCVFAGARALAWSGQRLLLLLRHWSRARVCLKSPDVQTRIQCSVLVHETYSRTSGGRGSRSLRRARGASSAHGELLTEFVFQGFTEFLGKILAAARGLSVNQHDQQDHSSVISRCGGDCRASGTYPEHASTPQPR